MFNSFYSLLFECRLYLFLNISNYFSLACARIKGQYSDLFVIHNMDALFLVQIFLKILMFHVNISKQVVMLCVANVLIWRGFLFFFILSATLLRIKLPRTPQHVFLISCSYRSNSNFGHITNMDIIYYQ
jgi:hypothetical protein